MQADWSVECGAGDPVVVLPWQSEDGLLRFVDLRAAPAAVEEISEARRYPCLATALRRWNALGSPIFTAKCDVWNYSADLFDADDLPGFAFAQGSYTDILSANAARARSFSECEAQLRRWTSAAQCLGPSAARCEFTLRSALIFPDATGDEAPSPEGGFATTLYVWGYGPTADSAASAWACAIEALIEPILLGSTL